MSTATERPIDAEERAEFENYAKSGLRLLSASESSESSALVAAVDAHVAAHQKAQRGFLSKLLSKTIDNTHVALALGIVWGNEIVRALGWKWTCIIREGEERYAVVSVDRSLAVYATYFVKECLDNSYTDCTILLSYNMLLKNAIPAQTPNSFFSVMPAVFRIVSKA